MAELFEIHLEGDLVENESIEDLYDGNMDGTIITKSHIGSISFRTTNMEFSGDEIFEILNVAHARQSLIEKILRITNNHSGFLDKYPDVSQLTLSDETINIKISRETLRRVCMNHENGLTVLHSLATYDTPVKETAESLLASTMDHVDPDVLENVR